MSKYVLDGQVYVQRKTGIYRYCNEILKELDKIIGPNEIELVVPKEAIFDHDFSNIKVVRYGKGNGVLWAQTYLPLYCIKNKVIPISFYNTTPIIRPGVVVIHDVGYKAYSKGYKNLYGRLSKTWHVFHYWYISKLNYPIITVSMFSKNEICKYYNIEANRIIVVGNGWQHYQRLVVDNTVFSEYPEVIPNSYFLSLGSLEERKNLKWIKEVAERNPEERFVVVGGRVKNTNIADSLEKIENVIILGRLEDEKVKALMCKAKAFVFPSLYEGFGIPPIEALSVGTKVLCSNTSSLPEVLGGAAIYFDPFDYEVDLKSLVDTPTQDAKESVLEKYSWEKSAQLLYKYLISERVV